jgi:hypothetical protein
MGGEGLRSGRKLSTHFSFLNSSQTNLPKIFHLGCQDAGVPRARGRKQLCRLLQVVGTVWSQPALHLLTLGHFPPSGWWRMWCLQPAAGQASGEHRRDKGFVYSV